MQFNLSIKSAVLLGLATFSSTANAVCQDGEVGVGNRQLCGVNQGGSSCGGNFGAVFANDCNPISTSWATSYCGGQWNGGTSVDCNGNGDVVDVWTPGGHFGWCYRDGGRCDRTIGISSIRAGVNWCCRRI